MNVDATAKARREGDDTFEIFHEWPRDFWDRVIQERALGTTVSWIVEKSRNLDSNNDPSMNGNDLPMGDTTSAAMSSAIVIASDGVSVFKPFLSISTSDYQ